MPSPTDTARLLADLESIAEAVRDIQRKAKALAARIADNEAADIADRLGNAAIAAGMPPARAFSYAEEYSAAIGKARGNADALFGTFGDLKSELDVLIHIAAVVPHRCPNPIARGGTRVLMLKD